MSSSKQGSTSDRKQLLDLAGQMQSGPSGQAALGPALGIYVDLWQTDGFIAAGEQAAAIYTQLGRPQEAASIYRELIERMGDPRQAYKRSQYVLALVQIELTTQTRETDRRLVHDLLEAQEVFNLNGDESRVGEVEQIRALFLLRDGDDEGALRRAERGTRIVASHQPASGEPVQPGVPVFAFASQN